MLSVFDVGVVVCASTGALIMAAIPMAATVSAFIERLPGLLARAVMVLVVKRAAAATVAARRGELRMEPPPHTRGAGHSGSSNYTIVLYRSEKDRMTQRDRPVRPLMIADHRPIGQHVAIPQAELIAYVVDMVDYLRIASMNWRSGCGRLANGRRVLALGCSRRPAAIHREEDRGR